jgi:hypothetical protein
MDASSDTGDGKSSACVLTIARLIAASLAVFALAGCGAATEPQQPSVSTPDDIVALIDSPRLTSLSKEGEVVTAEGQASRADGDSDRTYWFTSVGALAYVQEFGGSVIVRKVLNGTTVLDDGDGEEPVGTLPDPATFLSEEDLRAYADRHAEEAGVVVEEVNYVPFLGGTAEFVLRPTHEIEFMRNLDENMYSFFRDFPSQDPRPMLLTFVDSSGTNRRVQGSFPLSEGETVQFARLSDGTKVQIAEGEGFSWQADDLTKVLGVDASGRSTGPVEVAPGP